MADKQLQKIALRVDPLDLLLYLAEAGLTNQQLAKAIGISPSQFSDFLKKNPDFWDKLDAAKEAPNRQVEKSLFRLAQGYPIREIHKIADKPVKVILKERAPDVTACIFWLKNRDPKRWRDVIDVNLSLRDRMARAYRAKGEK